MDQSNSEVSPEAKALIDAFDAAAREVNVCGSSLKWCETRAALDTFIATLERKNQEYRDEATRCRHIAKRMMEGLDTHGVLAEIGESPTFGPNGFGVVICAPNLNEMNFGDAVRILVADLVERSGGTLVKVGEPRRVGTESDHG